MIELYRHVFISRSVAFSFSYRWKWVTGLFPSAPWSPCPAVPIGSTSHGNTALGSSLAYKVGSWWNNSWGLLSLISTISRVSPNDGLVCQEWACMLPPSLTCSDSLPVFPCQTMACAHSPNQGWKPPPNRGFQLQVEGQAQTTVCQFGCKNKLCFAVNQEVQETSGKGKRKKWRKKRE